MPDTARMQALIQSEDTFGTTMLAIAVEVIGENFLDWDPATIRMELEDSLRSRCHDIPFNRLMGAVNVITSDAFYNSLPDFVQIVNAIADGIPPQFPVLPDSEDLAWAMTEGLLLWPPDDDNDEPFAQEIVDYIGMTLDSEGLTTPPDILRLGLRADARNLLSHVQAEFADDPLLTQTIMQVQRDKTSQIEQNLYDDLRSLVQQLQSIGSDALTDVVPKLLQALGKSNENAQALQLQPGAIGT
jgi:hypothetical protein